MKEPVTKSLIIDLFTSSFTGGYRIRKRVEVNRETADLLFGFGHEKYLREFIQFLPGHQQTLLMSATLTEQVEMIKKLTMKKHVTLKLEEASLPDENVLQQFHICLNENFEKFLVALSFLKA